jgi:SWIM/SEC-C metal-binding protein
VQNEFDIERKAEDTMAKLGTTKHPAVARVQTMERAEEIMALCESHGWKVVVGVEPDKPEDVSDVERLLNPQAPVTVQAKVGRNDPCPCGNGLKYKQCCLRKRK